MSKKFEVGKTYEWYGREYDPITVLHRTPKGKMIKMTNGETEWRMLIKTGADGYEYVSDSSVPKNWRDAFTCSAKWEVKED